MIKRSALDWDLNLFLLYFGFLKNPLADSFQGVKRLPADMDTRKTVYPPKILDHVFWVRGIADFGYTQQCNYLIFSEKQRR